MSLLPDVNPLLVAGGPSLDMARSLYFGGGRPRNPNVNPNRRRSQSVVTPSMSVITGDVKKRQAVNYYFGGQQQFYGQQSPGGGYSSNAAQGLTGMEGTRVRRDSFSMGDQTYEWLMTGKISPEDMNIARNRAQQMGDVGPGGGRSGWGSGDYGAQDETMAQMSKGYYVGFGNRVKTVGNNKVRQQMASQYDDLRKYGFLGPDPWKEHNREVGMKLNELRDMLTHGNKYGYGTESIVTPLEHRRPKAPGEFTLGHGEGMRVRAWQRRQVAKAEEAKRDDLKKAEDTGDALQQEASVMRNAQETERT